MHWLLFIHKILFFSTCFEPQVLIFRRIQLYACDLTSQTSKKDYQQPSPYSQFSLKLCTDRPPGTLIERDSTIGCMYTTVSS